jgi:hypothetical protein
MDPLLDTLLSHGADRNHPLWDEVSAACKIVRRLDHPAHALFLIRPVDARIPDSVQAWSVSRECTDGHPFVSDDILILVMKAILPTAAQAVYSPWLDRYDIMTKKRTLREWDAFARETIANCHFTANWWARIKPSGHTWIGAAVCSMADDELAMLADSLETEEHERTMQAKRARREGTQAKSARPLRMTPNEVEVARCNAERRLMEHTRLLRELSGVLETLSTDTFEHRLPRIAACIVCLCRQHQRIQWNIRRALNRYASDLCDMSPWHVERELARHTAAVFFEPLEALKSMG